MGRKVMRSQLGSASMTALSGPAAIARLPGTLPGFTAMTGRPLVGGGMGGRPLAEAASLPDINADH